jgi:hypothetical protein
MPWTNPNRLLHDKPVPLANMRTHGRRRVFVCCSNPALKHGAKPIPEYDSSKENIGNAKIEERRMKIPRGKYIAKNTDPHKHEPEHFFKCETCGGWIDCRDLGSVFDHQGPHRLPPEDRAH